jgi:hypothetical protein
LTWLGLQTQPTPRAGRRRRALQDVTGAYDAAHRQLSDAEAEQRALLRALAAAHIAILILAAIFVPLALLLAGFAGARRTWRRYQRERVLNAS